MKPIKRAVFGHAKVVQLMQGRARVTTALGEFELRPGVALLIGAGVWCSFQPLPSVRMWTTYLDEEFLRTQLRWVLPDNSRVRPGAVPTENWDGSPVLMVHGTDVLQQIEPLLRQISVIEDASRPELVATRLISLFAQIMEATLPALLDTEAAVVPVNGSRHYPIQGTLTMAAISRQIEQAVSLLKAEMQEQWTMRMLANAVSTSPAHLTREFNRHIGITPMRYLTETRLTEFTRLLEETDLPVSAAASRVGWRDSRVAATWFRRRFGITPSAYRNNPHPSSTGSTRCASCRGACLLQTLITSPNAS